MAYVIYIDGLQLPVTPSKLTVSVKNQNETINLINDGEVNILKAPGLTDVSFEALIPQTQYPFADQLQDATTFIEKFEALKTEKKSFQFICSRATQSGKLLFDTNLTVSMEEYEIEEDAENGLDLVISVKLKQYKPYGTKTAVVKETMQTKTISVEAPRSSSKTPEKTYTVKSGDCLWNICKKELGDPTKYPAIAKLNNIKNPNLIYPGQVIKLE